MLVNLSMEVPEMPGKMFLIWWRAQFEVPLAIKSGFKAAIRNCDNDFLSVAAVISLLIHL